MPLEAGEALKGTGLAGVIAAARQEAYGKDYPLDQDAPAIDLEAKAIIDYFVTNTVVTVVDVEPGSETATGTIG